jgi:hypothetical protein
MPFRIKGKIFINRHDLPSLDRECIPQPLPLGELRFIT